VSTLFFFPFAALGFLRVIIASQMIVCCPASQSLSLSVPPASLLANRQLPIRGEQHTYVHGHKARERGGGGGREKEKDERKKKIRLVAGRVDERAFLYLYMCVRAVRVRWKRAPSLLVTYRTRKTGGGKGREWRERPVRTQRSRRLRIAIAQSRFGKKRAGWKGRRTRYVNAMCEWVNGRRECNDPAAALRARESFPIAGCQRQKQQWPSRTYCAVSGMEYGW